MKIVNCTPHVVTFVDGAGEIVHTIPASGIVPRVSTAVSVVGDINGIPDEVTTYRDVEGLPDPAPDTIYIVSALVANAVKGRDDLRVPGRQVRDSDGRVIGCMSLSRAERIRE